MELLLLTWAKSQMCLPMSSELHQGTLLWTPDLQRAYLKTTRLKDHIGPS